MSTKRHLNSARELTPFKTARHVRAHAMFRRKGVSVAAWSRANGFNPRLVFEVLSGRKAAHRGASHRIAVMLGIKDGDLTDGPQAVTDHFRSAKEAA